MTASWWERLRGVSPVIWDGVLAALLFTATAASASATDGFSPAVAWALAAAVCAPLAVRRRWPIAVLGVVAALTIAFALAGDSDPPLPVLAVAVYTVAAQRPWREVATIGLPVAGGAALACLIQQQQHANWVEVLVGLIVWVGSPVLLGRVVFARRERILRGHERAAHDAVIAERTRIARELHDVVAHAMSVMVVQAGAARTVVDRDPAAAKDAIATVEETGRAGLIEMRRLIGVLTDDGATPLTAPQPGLAQLDALVETMRTAGLSVDVVRTGVPQELSAGSDLAAYRIVQESLTNVLKHAETGYARVELTFEPDALAIVVEDDGPGAIGDDGSGHGLHGMSERAKVVGGTFEAGPRASGGFAVLARIPFGTAP